MDFYIDANFEPEGEKQRAAFEARWEAWLNKNAGKYSTLEDAYAAFLSQPSSGNLQSTPTPKAPTTLKKPGAPRKSKLDRIAEEAVGSNPDDIDYFKHLLGEVYKLKLEETGDIDKAIREVFAQIGYGGTNIGAAVRRIRNIQNRGGDHSEFPNFDVAAEFAKEHYPHLVGGTTSGVLDAESNLWEALLRGLPEITKPTSPEVIETALDIFNKPVGDDDLDFPTDYGDSGFLSDEEAKSLEAVNDFSSLAVSGNVDTPTQAADTSYNTPVPTASPDFASLSVPIQPEEMEAPPALEQVRKAVEYFTTLDASFLTAPESSITTGADADDFDLDSLSGVLGYMTQSSDANLLGRAARYWAYRQSPFLGAAVSLGSRMLPKGDRDPSLHPLARLAIDKLGGPAFTEFLGSSSSQEIDVGDPLGSVETLAGSFYTPEPEPVTLDSLAASEVFRGGEDSLFTGSTGIADPDVSSQFANSPDLGLGDFNFVIEDTLKFAEDALLATEDLVDNTTTAAEALESFTESVVDATSGLGGDGGGFGGGEAFAAGGMDDDDGFGDVASVAVRGAARSPGTLSKITLVALVALAVKQAIEFGARIADSALGVAANSLGRPSGSVSALSDAGTQLQTVDQIVGDASSGFGMIYRYTGMDEPVKLTISALKVLEAIEMHTKNSAENLAPFSSVLMGSTVDNQLKMLNADITRAGNIGGDIADVQDARIDYQIEMLRLQDSFFQFVRPHLIVIIKYMTQILKVLTMALDVGNYIKDIFIKLVSYLPVFHHFRVMNAILEKIRKAVEKDKPEPTTVSQFLDPNSDMNQMMGGNFNAARKAP